MASALTRPTTIVSTTPINIQPTSASTSGAASRNIARNSDLAGSARMVDGVTLVAYFYRTSPRCQVRGVGYTPSHARLTTKGITRMATVKTAISLDQALFKETNRTARELRVPRSRVISIALEEFFRRRRSREMTEQLNRVYAGGPTKEERRVQESAMAQLRERLKDEKW